MLVGDDHLPIGGAIVERVFLRRSAPIAIALPAFRAFPPGTAYPHGWIVTPWVVSEAIDFEVSKKEDVFIVLFKDDFKKERIQVLIFALILHVFYVEGDYLLDGVERQGCYRPGEVAYWMVVVLIVSERSGWQLYPSAYEVLLNAWLEL